MKNCENCKQDHDGSYGSGRFCSTKCARGFSTKAKRKEINEKVSNALIGSGHGNVKLTCKNCQIEFEVGWNKRYAKFCSNSCSITNRNIGSTLSKEQKEKISKAVKKLYKNGKTVYGGKTNWYDYKDIRVQGSYELRTCYILDHWKEIGKIRDWEYTNDRFEYVDLDDKKHNYLIDFKVYENNGSFYYLEIKGYKTNIDTLKWKAVKDLGHKLKVWFEEDIKEKEIWKE